MEDFSRLKQLPAPLLAWYDAHARILPWREEPTGYRVWISEIMLQQTRVSAVMPYYERFLKALPDVQALSEVEEETLLKLWEGLGYYSRARNLKKAAQQMMQRHGGEVPSDPGALMELAGIGPYTAGAIASIAYNAPIAAVDGNVLRVVSRICCVERDVLQSSVKKEFAQRLQQAMPQGRAGDFNQALMELGALICLPNGAPHCMDCPAKGFCKAKEEGVAQRLPVKAPKREKRVEEKTVFLIQKEDAIVLCKRGDQGLLAGLYQLPNVEGELSVQQAVDQLERWGIRPGSIQEMRERQHVFTHIIWKMKGYRMESEGENLPEGFFWADPLQRRTQYPLPNAFSKFLSRD